MSAKSKPSSRGGNGSGSMDAGAAEHAAASPSSAASTAVPPSPAASPVASASAARSSARHKTAPGGEAWAVAAALDMAAGETVAVDMVALIVKRSCDKLSEHYAQQCAMRNTARLAVEAVMQAIEWQLLGHDDGEKLSVRSVLAAQPAAAESATAAESEDGDRSSYAPTEAAPSPITEPHDRRRPAMDTIAQRLSFPSPYNQLWTCEDEPVPADLDRWARGVIPTKASAPPLALTLSETIGAGMTGAFTVHEADENARSAPHSVTPSRMHQHGMSGAYGAQLRSPGGLGGGSRKTAAEQAAELIALKSAAQPFRIEVAPTKEELAREKQRELELRRLDKKKRIAAEAASLRAQDDSERARLARIQSELSGRDYTFDNRGNAVLVAPLAPTTFPAIHPAPVVAVKQVFLSEEQEAEIAKREKRNRFKKGGPAAGATMTTPSAAAAAQPEEKQQSSSAAAPSRSSDLGLQKKKKPSGGKKSKADVEGFLDQNSTQLNLIQSLTLAKGVTLKQGGHVSKSHDPRSSSHAALDGSGVDHAQAELQGMTRKEYMKRLEERRATDSSFLPAVGANAAAPQPAAAAQAARVLVGSPGVSLSRSSSTRNALASAAAATTTAADESASPRGDEGADELEWSRPGSSAAAAPAASASASAAAASSSTSTGAHAHRRVTSVDAFNASITSDPSWGLNHSQGVSRHLSSTAAGGGSGGGHVPRPPQPHKPSEADRLAAVGRRSRNPRDRAHIDTIGSQVALRQHLPPAPLGKTTGHGLDLPLSPVASEAASRVQSAAVRTASSPTRPFAKVPAVPVVITATDKAKLYFA